MAPHDFADDAPLTRLERRRWRKLERQLESEDVNLGRHRTRRRVGIGVFVALLAAGAFFGGRVGALAVLVYASVLFALAGVYKLVWRTVPERPPRDIL